MNSDISVIAITPSRVWPAFDTVTVPPLRPAVNLD